MNNILIAFITGLTTGGLSCLAVQGGLLASSLSNQIEKDFQAAGVKNRKSKNNPKQKPSKLALPILVFLVAKLVAYSILGFLLGMVGQVFQLSPIARAVLLIAIGIFMLGNALRMLNVHPIFRFFVFEPPAFLRRKLRKTASGADGSSLVTPAFLGFMTVLIPCGIAQSIMAVALGTGNPLQGAALMFAFTLGTSPVFFAVSYFATQIGSKLEKQFVRFVAIVVLILAIVTINSGLTLAGSPINLSRLPISLYPQPQRVNAVQAGQAAQAIDPSFASPTEAKPDLADTEGSTIIINVENYGYNPPEIHAKAGVPVTLKLITEDVRSCSRAFIIPSLNVQKMLDQTGEATIQIPAQKSGAKINYSCSMGMYGGRIIFDL